MIIAIGCDLCDSRRIEKLYHRYAGQFLARVFTEKERTYCDQKKQRFLTYAKRFAAKEAVVKCLQQTENISWQDIEVYNDDAGAPHIVLKNQAAAVANAKAAPKNYQINVSLSDEGPLAMAMVVLSKS